MRPPCKGDRLCVTYEDAWHHAVVARVYKAGAENRDAPAGHTYRHHVQIRWSDGTKSSVDLLPEHEVKIVGIVFSTAWSDFTPLWERDLKDPAENTGHRRRRKQTRPRRCLVV